jgi:hypothetical protein
MKNDHVLKKCARCGELYNIDVKNFCSNTCFELTIQQRIKEACDDYIGHVKKPSQHIKKLNKIEKTILSWIFHIFFVVHL